MPNQIELKDAQQDQEIALLKHRVEQLEEGGDSKMVDELRERVRKLEKTVWGASAVITALITIVGLGCIIKRQGDGLWEQWYHRAGSRVTTSA